MLKEYSCGAILYTYEEGIRKYILVMEASGTYGFPKGHKEGNETDMETAIREIKEETGIDPEFIPNLKRTIRYKLINQIEKEVTFFVAKYQNQELNIMDKTILSLKKLDLQSALNILKFQELKNILIEIDYILDTKGE
ncbi:MAG: NUDIX domain-containing protein [Erysipelotrichaceae bacterium]|nr:NUDIX domain-containing protein [Erysipelotrichaceae bacterium]